MTAGRQGRQSGLLLLGAAGALGSLAMHMVVPALPQIARAFAASPGEAQLSISVYLVGLSLGQLSAGGLADTFGRRPVLLGGIAVFAAASLVAAISTSLPLLLVARFFQALGGAGALIAGRAIVADDGDGSETPRRLALLSSLLLISPAVAPAIGGFLQEIGGWRTIFTVLAAAAASVGTAAYRTLPETWVRSHPVSPLRTGIVLLGSWGFLRLALSNGLLSIALYAFLSVSPFLLIDRLGLAPKLVGLCLLWIAAAAITGTLLHRSRAISRYSAPLGRGVAVLGGIAFMVRAFCVPMSAMSLVVPMCLVTLGSGLSGPTILASALAIDRNSIGTASSIFGAVQMALSASGTVMVALLKTSDPRVISFLILGAVLIAFLLLPRQPRV